MILTPKLAATAQNSNFFIQSLNFKPLFALLTSNIITTVRLPQTRKRRKTVNTSHFGAKTSRYSSKFEFLNSIFEFQASFCITNLKHHNCEASAKSGHRGGLHRRENVEKQ